jgi:hemolysin III
LIYGGSLVLTFFASAAYHLIQARPEWIKVLRKVDHSAIYLLIAGTYTPFCYNQFAGFWRWGFLSLVWALALAGIVAKVLIIETPRWLTTGVYLAMGWMSVLMSGEMLRALPGGALVWLFVGGVFFTVGAVVYATKKLDLWPGRFGFHEVWHIFVVLGCLSHYIAVAVYVAPVQRVL